MFTGIITDIGQITAIERDTGGEWGDTRFSVACRYDPDGIAIGASIALAGACMTVIEKERTEQGCVFVVEVSDESMDKTHLSDWGVGTRMNLERAMKVGDEYGGHMVSGHVDAVGQLVSREAIAGSVKLTFKAPKNLLFGIAPKGSIVIDGVSLTVNTVEGDLFTVNMISHTAEVTTLGKLATGDKVNLEIDLIARYVSRYLSHMTAMPKDAV